MLSYAEENYLKAIYHLSQHGKAAVSTNAIAESLKTTPASVSDMIRKLAKKEVIIYQKYQGANISESGKKIALRVIRKHRLWEVFLVNKLRFHWDEVHEVAEQLEHIKSPLLIQRLDEFLDYPKFDPHGDPIPDENGEFTEKKRMPLNEFEIGEKGVVVAVDDSSPAFLRYLDKVGISIGTLLKVEDKIEFDGSMEINIDGKRNINISGTIARNILVAQ